MISFEIFLPRFAVSLVLGAAALGAGACGSSDGAAADGGTTPNSGTIEAGPGESTALAIGPSKLLDGLKAAGLDPAKLPTWEELEAQDDARKTKTFALMTSFAAALGTDCGGCHVEKAPGANGQKSYDFGADSDNKSVARRMYSEWVRSYDLADGQPLFCDSCHQGKAEFLDRTAPQALGAWMATNFVAGLAPKDTSAAKVSCTTCHGTSFDGSFLDTWAKGTP